MNVLLEREDLIGRLFFPSDRKSPTPEGAVEHHVPVDGASLHLRVHQADLARAGKGTLLLFHGNGENVCDWDEAARTFARHGVCLAVLDYRGYGASTGVPTFARLLSDAETVLAHVRSSFPGPLGVMGRSLGSAAAWALDTTGLASVVIDSGFTEVDAFAVRRGIDPQKLSEHERRVIDPLPRIAASRVPLLLLHGEEDRAIAVREAEAAFDASRSEDKTLCRLPGRGHNDLFLHPDYWRTLAAFLHRTLV